MESKYPREWQGKKLISLAQSKGIDEIRRTTVPAYTFLKFHKLPVEIQLRIWSLAASVHEPQFHTIGSISNDETQGFLPDSYPYCIKSSSGIDCREITWPVQRPPVPSILHVCQQSRGEGLKTYTRLAVKYHSCSQPGCELYFNVLYDIFYIGNEPWEGFKILVDILIKFNTTRPLQTKLRTGMDQLRNLRNILVDLNIFGAVPVAIWSKFPKLETLSIVFYPHKEIQDAEPNGYFNRRLALTRPQNGRHEKRASWVVRMAKSALEAVKKNTTPDWKLPTIEAVLRSDVIRYGDHYGSDSEEDDELSEDGSTGDDDEIVEVDDSTWYQQAAARMTHEVPKEELST